MGKLIIINGQSCGGKSTTVKTLLENHKHFFKLSYDNVKRFYVDYKADTHMDMVYEMLSSMSKTAIVQGYDCISDGSWRGEKTKDIREVFEDHGYSIYEFNIEADINVIRQRFAEKVKESAEKNIPISNTSVERLEQLNDTYQLEKNKNAVTYRSDRMTIEQIVSDIEKVCKLK